jgi:hypothetical protein
MVDFKFLYLSAVFILFVKKLGHIVDKFDFQFRQYFTIFQLTIFLKLHIIKTTTMCKIEPILQENKNRFVIFPIKHHDI